jgi:tetratricopeptide (TPR) repeat protein
MRKNIVVILISSLALALSSLSTLGAKSAANTPKDSRAFTEALTEAKRLADTDAGKAYDGEFARLVAPRLGDIVGECTKNLGPRIKFELVFIFAADGQLEQVLGPKDQPAVRCMREKFRDLHLPAPPHANWPVSLNVDISPDNAPRLLAQALKLMETGVWEVDATISRAFKFHVHGLLAGKDFDLTVEPEDRNAFRLIAIKDQLWASFDGSKTWKLVDAKGKAIAQRFYGFAHNPLRSEATSPALQVIKQETHDGDTWMQLGPKISHKKKSESERLKYWIAISQDPKRNGVRHYEGPVAEPGHEKEPLHCVATYQPANDKTIQPPEGASALPPEQSALSPSPDGNFAANSWKYSRDFYSKVHLVAIAKLDFDEGGTADFKYDRYPNGGPERIQAGDGEFARKDGKTWLKSNDWGDTGTPVDAQTAKRLNNYVGLINARLNGEPVSNDPSEGATGLKFIRKEDQGQREEFLFEESKEKPKSRAYPHVSFGRYKNDKDEQALLSHFSGPMSLGAREANVDIDFSYLIAVKVQEIVHKSPSPAPQAARSSPGMSPQSASHESPSPASDETDGNLVDRGIEKAKNGDLDGAITDFDRAIKADPKDDAPYFNRAQTKWLKKDADGAIADYTRAIELGSTNPAAYNNRGNARAENNDQDGAIADYTRAIELKPDYARAYYNRAVAKKEKGDASGAAADFKRARELDSQLASEESNADENSQSPSANQSQASSADLVHEGVEKGKKGDLVGAVADFDRAIKVDPKNAVAYYNRAHAKRLKKDAAGALADYNRAIEIDPQLAEAYFERGAAKAKSKDTDGAIADFSRAIELKSDYTLAYYNRGIAKKAKGDEAGAEADFKSAAAANKVSLLDGKLTIDIPPDFAREPDDPAHPKTIAKFSGPPDGAWGEVLRGTHGLAPQQLDDYLKKRVAEYSKDFPVPKGAHLQWLKKEIVTIDGRKWADWRFVPMLKGKKNYSYNPVYSRFLTTSYKGQLLEINFTSNLNTNPELKQEIDHIMDSVHLEE